MSTTIYDQINKLQQHVNTIHDAIAYKREYLIRGNDDQALKSKVRSDIRGLLEERKEYQDQIIELKLQSDKSKSIKQVKS
ncbi:MAG: hypothetical protein WCL00_06110 [Bacteroidota bacterium]